MSLKSCPFCMNSVENDTCPHCGKNIRYSGQPMHLPVGSVLNGNRPYAIGAALGQGGFGITYIGLDLVSGQKVAVKEYFPTYCAGRTANHTVASYQNQEEVYEKGRERFLDEARTLKSLSDLQGIVNVLDFFETNNTAYLVMEFLEGKSLKETAAAKGVFPAQEFLRQIRPLMEDIHRMHQCGVIHRDIAPDNIILLPDGQMKLIDFGAARSYLGDKSMTVVVKKGFAPLEQYMSRGSSSCTDVYALAATIYYCITGQVPPDSAERQYDDLPLTAPTALGADITPKQEKALFRALEVLQKARIQTVQEFLEEMEPEKPKPKPKKPADPKQEKPKLEKLVKSKLEKPKIKTETQGPPPRKKWSVILAAVAAVLVLLAGFFLFGGNSSNETVPANNSSGLQKPAEISSEQTEQEPETETPADRITEKVTLNVLVPQYGNNSADWWTDFSAAFTAEYPQVDLVLDVVSWNDIYSVVNNRIANGDSPDILNMDDFSDYQADGLLLSVNAYMSDETYAKFYPQFLDQSLANGKVWAVPDLTSVRALYYNKEIFDELGLESPSTWTDIEHACEVIRRNYPNIDPIGLDMTTDDGHSTFFCFSLSNGGGFVNSRGEWNLNCTENVETLRFLNGLVSYGFTNPDPTTETRWALQDLFIDRKIAMTIAPDSFADTCKSAGLAYGVVPIPANEGKQSSTMAVMDRFMCFDNNHSASELAAITCFFDFFYEDERYAEWTTMEGFLPATSTGNEFLTVADPEKAAWNNVIGSAQFYPVAKAEWADVKLGVVAVQQEVLLGGDAQKLLDALQTEIAG